MNSEWEEREALALALDTIFLATGCIPQPWKLFIFFILKMVKNSGKLLSKLVKLNFLI